MKVPTIIRYFPLGPLLYHFADMPTEMSIELSWADLRDTILKFGFQMLVRHRFIDRNTYTHTNHCLNTKLSIKH